MNLKKLVLALIIPATMLCRNLYAMDFVTSKVLETVASYEIAKERLSDVESLRIFGGVALSALAFDFLYNYAITTIKPDLCNIDKKKDTWDIKLFKTFKESLSSTNITNITLGLSALFYGYLFSSSPLTFSDMVKPGVFLLSGVAASSLAIGIRHSLYNERKTLDTILGPPYDFLKLSRTANRMCLATFSCMLPLILKYR